LDADDADDPANLSRVLGPVLEGKVIASHPTVRQLNTVVVNPESGRVFVAGAEGEELQIVDPR
jgi:hypothetical protein